ncbi:MAG: M14-type cytosolic carboxypeptidase [candidate division Zixibacteria bacterium]
MIRAILITLVLAAAAVGQITPDDFIADFESGNITNVQQVGVDSFTVQIRLDDNHGDTYGWYYFAIANNQGRTATIFLTNPDGWQNANCAPVVSADNVNWGRAPNVWSQSGWLCFRQHLPNDTVWFAQGFPYTVSEIYSYLDELETSPYTNSLTLGHSVHDRPVDMITITDDAVPIARKKTAWLISRQHPMESGPTFMLTGLMDRVLEDDSFADYFRRDINLKIVPIVNVDGVAEGYSRHNVNGINLNRDWRLDMENEQPSVQAVHVAIDGYLSWGNSIDLFMDLHAAPDNNDFGFRISENYNDQPFYDNQGTFLHLLETFDSWQEDSRWRNLDTNYANGVSCVVMYDLYNLDALTTETPWTRRENNQFITRQTLYDQGEPLAYTIYDYLYPLTVYDDYENRIDSIVPGQTFMAVVNDYDQRNHGSVEITALCYATADSEQVVCYRQDVFGIFAPFDPIPTNSEQSIPNDGILTVLPGAEIVVKYIEPEIPDRICQRFIAVEPSSDIAWNDLTIPLLELSAYPNPFNSSTNILYSDVRGGEIRIFDIMGRVIKSFETYDNGKIVWDGTDDSGNRVVSGIYFAVLAGDNEHRSVKLVYLR